MARGSNKLTDRTVRGLREPGRYGDGKGLWLQIGKEGGKSWLYRYMLNGHARMMGLGSYPDFSLEEARDRATACRKLLKDGKDPIDERKAQRQVDHLARSRTLTFDECARSFIEANRPGWKNDKHAQQWENTLATYASPIIGKVPVSAIDTGHVLRVLEADNLWTAKPETASRVRGRIEAVLGWATVRKYRSGDNPAQWKNHLDKALPARAKVATVEHHPALPYSRVGAFVAELRKQGGIGSRALEFAILTAARSGEVRGATWSEFDLDTRRWIIPAERMKARKEHHIPLSDGAIDLLEGLPGRAESEFVFPAPRGGVLSDMTMTAALRRMQGDAAPIWTDTAGDSITVHGFRSTFRDWAGETTAYPREVIEHALAHQLRDKAEAAYARGTLFDKRRRLMDDWSTYCGKIQKAEGANVLPIGRKGKTAA